MMRPFLFLLFVCVSPSFAVPQALFSRDGIQRRLVLLINGCQSRIEAGLYELTSPLLIQALRRAHDRGVDVRIILNTGDAAPPLVRVRHLAGREPQGIMHNKFAIFDGEQVVTGSYNWTNAAEKRNYENALIEDDPGTIQQYEHEFELLWGRASSFPISNSGRLVLERPRALFAPRHRRYRRRGKL